MDRKVIFIGGGVLVVVIVALILIFSFAGKGEREEPVDQTRLNTLELASEYLEQGEYQRALDLLDRLLIADSGDLEAKELRNSVIEAKRASEASEKEQAQQEQEELKDAITESIKEVAPQPAPEPEKKPDPEPEPEPEKEDPEAAAAREAEERRRQEEARRASEVRNLIEAGVISMEDERYIEARRNFTEALELDDDSAEAYAQMGEAFYREDSESERNLQKAVEYSSKAIEKDQAFWLPHFTLGKIYESTQSYDDAATEFAEAARLNPERDDIWFALGKVQFRAGKYAEAARSFHTTTHLNPKNDKAFLNLGVTYERLGGLEDALTAYGAAFQTNPENSKAYYLAGNVLMQQHAYEDAIPLFVKSLALIPPSDDSTDEMKAARELATAYYFIDDYEASELNYRKAYNLNPGLWMNNYNLAVVLLRRGNASEAFEYAAVAVQLNGQSPAALFTLGEVSERLDDLDTAMMAYQRAVDLDPEYLKARINLGKLYDENGMYDEALPHLVAAYRIDEDSLEVNNNLGNVYLHKKLYRDAITHYQKAIMMKRNATLMRYHLAIAYIETEQFALAKDTLLELLKISADYWDAHYQLGKIYFSEDNIEEARQMFRNLLENNPEYEHREEIEKLLG